MQRPWGAFQSTIPVEVRLEITPAQAPDVWVKEPLEEPSHQPSCLPIFSAEALWTVASVVIPVCPDQAPSPITCEYNAMVILCHCVLGSLVA